MKNLGDKVAFVAQPIARGFDRVFGTDLRNCGGCKKMRRNLNAGMNLADAIYDRFWPAHNGTKNMKWIITKQIAVETGENENENDALAKAQSGKLISMTIVPRPERSERPERPEQVVMPASGKPPSRPL